MPKNKEQIRAYNKLYFARPDVVAHAKARNAERRQTRAEYKRTEVGRAAEVRYKSGPIFSQMLFRNRLKSRYSLTVKEFGLMLVQQHGLCAICLRAPKHWHIDHCHDTGKVRGLLCGPCNMALGLFQDNQVALRKALDYLSR